MDTGKNPSYCHPYEVSMVEKKVRLYCCIVYFIMRSDERDLERAKSYEVRHGNRLVHAQ